MKAVSKMRGIFVSIAELEALEYLPLLARVLYIQVFRQRMDFKTGTVGVKANISYLALCEETEVAECYSQRHRRERPSRDQVKRAVDCLVRAGLLIRIPKQNQMDTAEFRMSLAQTGSLRPQKPRPDQARETPPVENADMARVSDGAGIGRGMGGRARHLCIGVKDPLTSVSVSENAARPADDEPAKLPLPAFTKQAQEAITFLNQRTSKTFRAKHPNGKLTHGGELIKRILKHGYAMSDIRIVIARKVREWGDDEKMHQYLTPDTLFRLSNFTRYRGETDAESERQQALS